MKKFTRKVKKAFTLIELVVVIAVIAILSAVSVGTYFGVMNNAKKSAINQEAIQLRDALRTQTVTTYTSKDMDFTATLTTTGIKFADKVTNTNTVWAVPTSATEWEKVFLDIYKAFSSETPTTATTLPGKNKLNAVTATADGVVTSFVMVDDADANIVSDDIKIVE